MMAAAVIIRVMVTFVVSGVSVGLHVCCFVMIPMSERPPPFVNEKSTQGYQDHPQQSCQNQLLSEGRTEFKLIVK